MQRINMLIFSEFFKTQSDQNTCIHQNALICTKFSKFSREASSYAPEPPSIKLQL